MIIRPLIIALAALGMTAPAHAADPAAGALLRQALTAQGGEATLRTIGTVRWSATGYRNMLEQSERPEGPYIVEHQMVSDVHDHQRGRQRSVTESSIYPVAKFTTGFVADKSAAMRLAGDTRSPGTAEMVTLARETLALSPERLLLTALDAPDAHVMPAAMLQSVVQDVIAFTLDGAPVTIFLDRYTHLPTAMDYAGPLARAGYWRFLGDTVMRTSYSFWWIGKGGVKMPLQWDVSRNGLPEGSWAISKLSLETPATEAELQITPEIRTAFAALPAPIGIDDMPFGSTRQPPVDLAPGIVLVPGAWNVTFVRQDDGVVIIEAPISSGYAAKSIAEARRRFPGVPVKAVITTSDSWPHLAGVREYVAAGIPIYHLDINAPILKRVIAAPYTSRPDALQRKPRQAILRPISGATTLGTGANRMVIYPLHGEVSERQMMIWFPDHRLLYGSDPFQGGGERGYSFPQAVSEVTDATAREGLKPERFFMMHIGPTPWSELARSIAEAGKDDGPDGKY
ncbi:hypothetical protein [Sphingomonas sp. UYAg733]